MSTYSNRLQPAIQNLLWCVVRFFHPWSSCTTTHISADVQRMTLNGSSCITISSGRTEQLDIIAGFLPRYWLYEWFSQFHSCGTYSVLSRSPSNHRRLMRVNETRLSPDSGTTTEVRTVRQNVFEASARTTASVGRAIEEVAEKHAGLGCEHA